MLHVVTEDYFSLQKKVKNKLNWQTEIFMIYSKSNNVLIKCKSLNHKATGRLRKAKCMTGFTEYSKPINKMASVYVEIISKFIIFLRRNSELED